MPQLPQHVVLPRVRAIAIGPADFSGDGGVGDFGERCVEIAGDGGGLRSAGRAYSTAPTT
jgi:hypothetical protein